MGPGTPRVTLQGLGAQRAARLPTAPPQAEGQNGISPTAPVEKRPLAVLLRPLTSPGPAAVVPLHCATGAVVTLPSPHGCGQSQGSLTCSSERPGSAAMRLAQRRPRGWDAPLHLVPRPQVCLHAFILVSGNVLLVISVPLTLCVPQSGLDLRKRAWRVRAGVHVSKHPGVRGSVAEQGLGCQCPGPSRF